MNERCKKILVMLLQKSDYTPIQKLAAATKVSKRSIYYDICGINEWLEQHKIPELLIERGKGLFIPQGDKQTIERLLQSGNDCHEYIFRPSERIKIIICYIMHSKEPVFIEQLMEACQVSRNTIFGDLQAVVSQLQNYDLNLKYESKRGYIIAGDIVRGRALCFLYFSSISKLFSNGVLKFMNQAEIEQYYERLRLIESELKINYVEGVLLSLAALLPIMYQNRGNLYFDGLKKEEVFQKREFQLVEKQFPDLAESEKIYLCLHLLGSQITSISSDIFEYSSNQSVYEITKALVMEFEKLVCVTFENKEELERALFVHIQSSMYRYRYGIQIGNSMTEDIIREYPSLFELVKIVCKYLEQIVGIPLPDSEIAYLALHFGAHLKISKPDGKQLRILIVCANGISTGNMLKREVQKLIPNADIVGVVAAVNIINIHELCDLVISTIKVQSVIPCIIVHPILTNEDRTNILNHHLVVSKRNDSPLSELLFDTVKKYVDEGAYRNLKRDIIQCLQSGSVISQNADSAGCEGLFEFLDISKVHISEEACLWQEGIRYAGRCLIDQGSIESRYIDTIISQTMFYGTYMFLTNDVMLAHAKPEDGVIRTDISVAVFRSPVVFQNNRSARIIFVLSTEDHEKHLNMLNDIFTIVEKQEQIDKIAAMPSEIQLISYLKKILEASRAEPM